MKLQPLAIHHINLEAIPKLDGEGTDASHIPDRVIRHIVQSHLAQNDKGGEKLNFQEQPLQGIALGHRFAARFFYASKPLLKICLNLLIS